MQEKDNTMTNETLREEMNRIDRELTETGDTDAAFVAYRMLSSASLNPGEEWIPKRLP